MGRGERLWIRAEDALIILGLLTLWPRILGAQGRGWVIGQFVALAVLAVIAVVRVRRLLIARRETQERRAGNDQ